MTLYLLIGLIYWAINSFVRKLETNGDWMLPLVWFLAWPLALIAWAMLFIQFIVDEIVKWVSDKDMKKHF